MALDLVRQASKVLGPLLRRRGTSPALGAGLRKALGALDKSLSGLDAQKQEATIDAGISELRACVALIAASQRPADHEQLEGIKKALAILAPEEAPVDAAPALAAPLAGLAALDAQPAKPADSASAHLRQPLPAPAQAFASVAAQLQALATKLQFLHVTLSEPLFRMNDACAAEAELRRHVRAIGWLGCERVPQLLRAIDSAKSTEDRLFLGAALVYIGAERGGEWLLTILGHAAAVRDPFPEISPTLLRTLADAGFLEGSLAALRKPAPPAVCSLLLPLLAEQGLLPAATLWELVGHPKDEVAIPAAHALRWTAGSEDVAVLLGHVTKAKTARRAPALLAAAVARGSGFALDETRTRLRDGATVDFQLVETLAVAGNAADADLLLGLAERPDVDADRLALAAAHLGSKSTLEALPSLAERVSAPVMAECKCTIAGSAADEGAAGALDPGTRYLRGEPWSVAGLFARLASPDEPVLSQQRLALDLRIRTGLAPPKALPLLASPASRAGLVAEWGPHFAQPQSRLKPGDWYFQGRPLDRGAPS